MKSFLFLPLLLMTLPASAEQAAEHNAVEMKLRESLKNTVVQLRSAQTEMAALQATQAAADAKAKELAAKVETLTKQAAADQTASRKSIDELTARNANLQGQVAKLAETLEKWKAGYAKAVEVARAKEAERARLADENAVLNARVRDLKAGNLALFKLGNDILTRYEKFSVGDALSAREPFTKITRARLESYVQDARDKLADARIKPEPPKH